MGHNLVSRRVLALLAVGLFLFVAFPLVLPIVMGGVLAVLFLPFQKRLEHMKFPPAVAGGVLTLAISVLLLLPSSVLIFIGARSGFAQIEAWRNTPQGPDTSFMDQIFSAPKIQSLLQSITQWFPVKMEDLIATAQDLVRSTGTKIADLLGQLLTHLPGITLGVVIIILSVYFFLIDGRKIETLVKKHSFLAPAETDKIFGALAGTCRSVILATVVSGFVQAIVESSFCLSLGVPNVALIGILVFLASFIPIVGSAPITLGIVVQQAVTDHTTTAIVLLVAAVIIAVVDNLIRPWFLRGAANIHPFVAFVATLGGLQTLGFMGVFIGPIVAALAIASVEVLLDQKT